MKLEFGNPEHIAIHNKKPGRKKKSRTTKPNGYAGKPGTGPKGEKCKTCKHLCKRVFAKTYYKCALYCKGRTRLGGRGSDVLLNSPACQKWEPVCNKAVPIIR